MRRSNPPKTRRRESMATRSWPSGSVYSRRTHTRAARSAASPPAPSPLSPPAPSPLPPPTESLSHHLATGAGTVPCPGTRAGSITERVGSPVPSSARSVITRCTSTGCTCPVVRPDSSARAVSVATAPTPRPWWGSSSACPATTVRARAARASWAPTTSVIGPSTVRYAMPSGAARIVTRRDATAASMRRTTDAASSSAATLRAACSEAFTPSRPSSGPTRASTTARSAGDRHDVASTTLVACASEHRPEESARNVCGISCTSARLTRTKRSPQVGVSLRASATSEPIDRAASCGAATSRERRTSSTNLA